MTAPYSWGLKWPRSLSATFQTNATLSANPCRLAAHRSSPSLPGPVRLDSIVVMPAGPMSAHGGFTVPILSGGSDKAGEVRKRLPFTWSRCGAVDGTIIALWALSMPIVVALQQLFVG